MIVESPLTERMGLVLTGSRDDLSRIDRAMLSKKVAEHGAVILRGFELTVDDFETLSQEVAPEFLVHHDVGRMYISDDGTTQTVVPGMEGIPAHVERGYAAPIPATLFFYCNHPPDSEGETTLYDGFELFERLSPESQKFFAERKVRYRLRIGPELWQRTLMTDDHAEAMYMIDEQLTSALDVERGEAATCRVDDDTLIMDFVTPATRTAARREGVAFSNSGLTYLYTLEMPEEGLLALGKMTMLTEEDEAFPLEILRDALRASREVEYKLSWRKGDMALLDNRTVLHGRAAFSDPNRSIYIRIGFGL
ncbi:hypothetical protein ASD21_22670 [Caulobacter sp. Root1455]|uniref:TauD/TfdA family dioxygenase n=1 Tax=unclassified Caulobacter TaxID=2648921 RepID=UPI0006F79A2F|nr:MULTISPECIES: TauD/TfdA family dioxygenase [unclassified Caulobacter]KQY26182.1 hypothetical protein ASD38_20795 [Caulobacter sp. Root487D2Y]KQY98684.1 hypothetical protein ASD21_22670 [Caulobacter sp. Root1455]